MTPEYVTPKYLHHVRQRDAFEQLGELLALGQRNELPPLTWTIADNAVLTGEVGGWDHDAEAKREAITVWARWLRTEVQETDHADGITRLYAPFGPENQRTGCIRAELRSTR